MLSRGADEEADGLAMDTGLHGGSVGRQRDLEQADIRRLMFAEADDAPRRRGGGMGLQAFVMRIVAGDDRRAARQQAGCCRNLLT